MITLIVGHRGSGKSNLLLYLQSSNVLCLDLDLEIKQSYGESIEKIFSAKGEVFFRHLEQKTLYKVIKYYKVSDKDIYISVGAGFLGSIPNGVRVIWLQRKTDTQARIFFNRPRLDKGKSPSQEYKERFLLREKYYLSVAHEVVCLPEHIVESQLAIYKDQCPAVEKFFIYLQKFISLYLPTKAGFLTKGASSILNKGGITLVEGMFKDRLRGKAFLEKRLAWGVLFFEVRDDLISKKTFFWIKSIVPLSKLLLSCRVLQTYFISADLKASWAWDWPIEKKLESCPFKVPFSVISLHSRKACLGENIFSYLEAQINLANKHNLQYKHSKKVHCKWSPTITSLEALQNLYVWFKKDPEQRSILPMSLDGRWAWFRLYLYGKIKINFIKESRESCFKDQILLADKIFTESKQTSFAAILGKPVAHSLTPFVHYDFFQNKNVSIYSILLSPPEVTANNIDFLTQLGLKYAAITSPLKKEFFNLKYAKFNKSLRVEKRKSVNTLTIPEKQKKIILDNTDQEGLVFLIKSILGDWSIVSSKQKNKNIALWGAGGVSSTLAEVYPEVFIFSAQKKKCINHHIDEDSYFPDIILWAVPSIYKNTPPEHWSPSTIIDLNYSEDSCGREYALLKKATYASGLLMFLAQAKEQQKLWASTYYDQVVKS